MIRSTRRVFLLVAALRFINAALAQDKLVFSTDWLAEAEHVVSRVMVLP